MANNDKTTAEQLRNWLVNVSIDAEVIFTGPSGERLMIWEAWDADRETFHITLREREAQTA
jgi:hypothetical protein